MMRQLSSLLTVVQVLASPAALGSAQPQGSGGLGLYDAAGMVITEAANTAARETDKVAVLVKEQRTELEAALNAALNKDKPEAADKLARQAVDQLIGKLPQAHGRIYDKGEQDYWALASAFSGELTGARFRHIGALFERKGKRWFIRRVLEGSPAAKAGLATGDEIVSVGGKELEPVGSFAKMKDGETAKVEIRHVPWEKPRTVEVATVHESLQESLLRAMQRSAHVYAVKGKKVGYVWLPMASHEEFKETLRKLAGGMQTHTDALVLDLRGGFGSEGLAYMDLFVPELAATSASDAMKKAADQATKPSDTAYKRPMVALIDERTSGGRELLAYVLQKSGRAQVMGERSAGLTHAGRLYALAADQYALYYAPAPQKPISVEGRGVEPEKLVDQALMYAAGADQPLAAALAAAAALK